MFQKYFRKEKPHIYLGQLAIVPKEDWKRIDERGIFRSENLEVGLKKLLEETFVFQSLSERQVEAPRDLALDVFVSSYSGGAFDAFSSSDFFIPIVWRPEVELKARVTSVGTGKIVTIQSVKVKMRWGTYFSRVFSCRGVFRMEPLFDIKDVEPLFFQAAHQILLKIKKATNA
jgi:hypothetical protein